MGICPSLLATMMIASPTGVVGGSSWEWCVLIHTAWRPVTLLAAASCGARPAGSESVERSALRPTAFLREIRAADADCRAAGQVSPTAPAGYVNPRSPPRTFPRGVSDHPVLWRETRRPLFLKRWQSIAAACVVLGSWFSFMR